LKAALNLDHQTKPDGFLQSRRNPWIVALSQLLGDHVGGPGSVPAHPGKGVNQVAKVFTRLRHETDSTDSVTKRDRGWLVRFVGWLDVGQPEKA